MKVIKVTKEYFETEDEKVYFFEPLEKEINLLILCLEILFRYFDYFHLSLL